METRVKSRLQAVRFGEAQHYKNMVIVPIISPEDGRFQYLTLGEALATGNIAVTEVSTGGSVPELMVVNRGNKPVLLIDGEELAGAKQNRVLNTSILIKEVSETKIPVSCTEQGRWSYASQAFSESGNVMAYKSRSKKTRSVQCSLEESGVHHSNQGEVWDGIAELQAKAGGSSATSAMSDIYANQRAKNPPERIRHRPGSGSEKPAGETWLPGGHFHRSGRRPGSGPGQRRRRNRSGS